MAAASCPQITPPLKLFLIAALLLPIAFGGSASASFFQVAEQCPSGLGNAFAGGAAVADDACVVWYNPAGMTRLPGKQVVVGLHLIEPSLEYSDHNSSIFLGQPIQGGDGGDAGDLALIPNLYYTHEIKPDKIFFGLGINAPYGLTTDYEDDWVGRYHADRSELKVINLNPSLAFKVSPAFSLGLGANYQTIEAELTQAIDFGSTCVATELGGQVPVGTCATFSQSPQLTDGNGKVEADDDSFGWNAGLLWEPNASFRLGAAYRSEVSYTLTGDFTVTTPNPSTAAFASAIGVVDGGASAEVDMPDALSVSGHWQVNPKFALMADWTRTGWSAIPELRIQFDSGPGDSVSTFDLEDSDRFALGGTITPCQAWTVRLGFALDETPTPNAEVRSARLPDEDRTWYTAGVAYDPPGSNWTWTVSYALVEIDEAEIDKRALPNSEDFLRGTLQGEFDFGINILSVQAGVSF